MTPAPQNFILASASPRRVELLAQLGFVPSMVVPASVDETPCEYELPRALAMRLAEAKAQVVAAQYPDIPVLAADTVVACGRRILPKAENEAEVTECLKLLAGRRHRVYGGICLVRSGAVPLRHLAQSIVRFKPLTASEIESYATSGEGVGKAGGYAIQGRAAGFINFISGSYNNIVGLDLFIAAQLLRRGAL